MPHQLNNTVAVLRRTPAALDAMLRGLPEIWTRRNEGAETWNASEVIGHLIEGERTDWIPRVRCILEFGEGQAFEPFDMAGYQREMPGKTTEQLLDEFARLRSSSLAELDAFHLRDADLDRRGRHPGLGTVTLSQLLATWAAHDLTHVHQISRVMAHQYRDSVGPWIRYLGVLQCGGHSVVD